MGTTYGTQLASALATGNSDWVQCPGGACVWSVAGTFDSATAVLQARDRRDPTNVWSVADASLTAAGSMTVVLSTVHDVRVSTSGGGGTQSLNSFITPAI